MASKGQKTEIDVELLRKSSFKPPKSVLCRLTTVNLDRKIDQSLGSGIYVCKFSELVLPDLRHKTSADSQVRKIVFHSIRKRLAFLKKHRESLGGMKMVFG